jgi:hypothetical protein
MNNDIEIYNFIWDKVITTTGDTQKEWVKKYDIFTCRSLFSEKNIVDKLEEVEKIRKEFHKIINENKKKNDMYT